MPIRYLQFKQIITKANKKNVQIITKWILISVISFNTLGQHWLGDGIINVLHIYF